MKENNFPFVIFPPKVREIVKRLSEERGFPKDYTAGVFLLVFSVLVGSVSCLETILGKVFANIYLILVGPQGSDKSRPLRYALKPLLEVDRRAIKKYNEEMAEYRQQQKLGVPMTNRPTLQRYCINDSTPEAIVRALEYSPKGSLQYYDEITQLFGSLRYQKGNASSVEDMYLSLFNGDTVIVDRVTKDEIHQVSRPYFCLGGTTQNSRFLKQFAGSKFDSGFMARFLLIIHYDDNAKLWNLKEDLPDTSIDDDYASLVHKLMAVRDNGDTSDPVAYRLADDAAETIQDWQNGHEMKIEEAGKESDRATFRKVQLYVLKFSLLIQIVWDVAEDQENKDHVIDNQSALFATLLADYFFENAREIAKSLNVPKLNNRELCLFRALDNEFTSQDGLEKAKSYRIGKSCFYEFISKCKGYLLDQHSHGVYTKRDDAYAKLAVMEDDFGYGNKTRRSRS